MMEKFTSQTGGGEMRWRAGLSWSGRKVPLLPPQHLKQCAAVPQTLKPLHG